jgi:hypothetical protein
VEPIQGAGVDLDAGRIEGAGFGGLAGAVGRIGVGDLGVDQGSARGRGLDGELASGVAEDDEDARAVVKPGGSLCGGPGVRREDQADRDERYRLERKGGSGGMRLSPDISS